MSVVLHQKQIWLVKTEVDKIGADKLKTVPVNLAKYSNVVKMMLLKKN